MKIVGLFLIFLFVHQINGYANRRCGAQLSQIMWMLCENGFNTMPTKRGDPSSLALDNALPYPYNSNSLADIFQFDEGNLMAKNRRTRMLGIVDECCKNACTYKELKAYCMP
ncbi:insulin-like peptide 5 [Cochliomyia hominivorax]